MSASAKDDGFELGVEVARESPRSRRAGYPRGYSEYAEIFDASERTVKHWVKMGKEAGELPPLEDPSEMPNWWGRHMKQRVPQNLLDASTRAFAEKQVLAPVVLPQQPVLAAAVTVPVVLAEESHGIMVMVKTKREQVAIAYRALVTAQSENPPDPAKVESATRSWSKLAKELEEAELKAQKFGVQSGQYIDRTQLQTELTSMLAASADAIRSLYRRLKPKLAIAQDESEEDEIFQAGVDEVFGELVRSGYAKPFSLSA